MAVVGIGQVLRGDDAVGPAVVNALRARLEQPGAPPRPPNAPALLLLDAGHAPESQTGPLRRFAPDLILLIDAARMEEPPGTVRWLSWQEIAGIPASTHTLPLSLLAEFLARDLGSDVALIGVQPMSTELGEGVSPAADAGVREVVEGLAALFAIPDVQDVR